MPRQFARGMALKIKRSLTQERRVVAKRANSLVAFCAKQIAQGVGAVIMVNRQRLPLAMPESGLIFLADGADAELRIQFVVVLSKADIEFLAQLFIAIEIGMALAMGAVVSNSAISGTVIEP